MSTHICAFDHNAWDEAGLQDYGDFSESVEFCNQSEYGDGQLEGDWYYVPDEPLAKGKYAGCRVIYSGDFGNYNAPGASSYTYTNIYDMKDEQDAAAFEKAKAEWEASPEYTEETEAAWDEDEDEEDDEDE